MLICKPKFLKSKKICPTDNWLCIFTGFLFCFYFYYRDFTGGTLGLAWVASPSGASGGICERYKTYSEKMADYPRTTKRSLNTGIITFVNYNSRVPPKVSQLTLAHEIGHNFGSPHDYPSQCRPGGVDGNNNVFNWALLVVSSWSNFLLYLLFVVGWEIVIPQTFVSCR